MQANKQAWKKSSFVVHISSFHLVSSALFGWFFRRTAHILQRQKKKDAKRISTQTFCEIGLWNRKNKRKLHLLSNQTCFFQKQKKLKMQKKPTKTTKSVNSCLNKNHDFYLRLFVGLIHARMHDFFCTSGKMRLLFLWTTQMRLNAATSNLSLNAGVEVKRW